MTIAERMSVHCDDSRDKLVVDLEQSGVRIPPASRELVRLLILAALSGAYSAGSDAVIDVVKGP